MDTFRNFRKYSPPLKKLDFAAYEVSPDSPLLSKHAASVGGNPRYVVTAQEREILESGERGDIGRFVGGPKVGGGQTLPEAVEALKHAFGGEWPGPYTDEIANSHAERALGKIPF